MYYVLTKYASHWKLITLRNALSELIDILKVDNDIFRASLASDVKDFEYVIQYITAQEYKRIDVIIIRNIKDYKKSALHVITPETFLKMFEHAASS